MLENAIINYFANAVSASDIAEQFNLHWGKTLEILRQAQGEWDNIDVGPEGTTIEQDWKQDLVIIRAAEALEEIKKESN